MTLKEKFDELWDLKLSIESKSFQDNIMKPLFADLDKLKPAYKCESLREMATLKGKYQGMMWLVKRLKEIEVELKNTKYELESRSE